MSRAEFYRLVSNTIRAQLERTSDPHSRAAYVRMADSLATAFARHNSKFDAERFHRDAGTVA